MVKIRSFIAIDIRNENVARIAEELNRITGVKAVEKENLHITLKFLGEIEKDLIDKIYDEIKELSEWSQFRIFLKGIGAFPSLKNPRVIWVGVENEDVLYKINDFIENRISKFGFKREDFKPHLTIARIKNPRAKIHVIKLVEKYINEFFGEEYVKEIKIKKSTLTPKGPIYEDLKIIKLS